MVQLKAAGYYPAPVIPQFQFLMVQLKASFRVYTLSAYAISIPYGSIKSIFHVDERNRCFISIPYGSIKSVGFGGFYRLFALFQFLMVQLKV